MQFTKLLKLLLVTVAVVAVTHSWSARSYAVGTWPVRTGFENYTLGDLNGQQGWETQSVVDVQNTEVAAGAQAVRLSSQSLASYSAPATTRSIVYVEAYTKAEPDTVYPELPAPAGASCLLFFHATDGIVCLDGDGLGSGTWKTTGIQADQWTQVSIEQNYQTDKWKLFVNGAVVLENLGNAYNDTAAFQKFECQAGEAGPMLLDDFYTGANEKAMIGNVGATDSTTGSARLHYAVSDIGEHAPEVSVFYGMQDADMDMEMWGSRVDVVGALDVGAYYTDLAGLRYSTAYYYRTYALNTAGGAWSEQTTPFYTEVKRPVVGDPSVAIDDTVDLFYMVVLGRPPEPNAVISWHEGYYDVAVALQIDVRFVVREMARQFFLSDEYLARNRTDEEFINDCYRAFLFRTPSQGEVDDYLNDVDPETGLVRWNRAEVMTRFAESEEFLARVAELFPDLEGVKVRNFVTFMYIGIFDRLSDTDGLNSWAADIAAAEDKQLRSEEMALLFFESEEGQIRAPDNQTKVIRCYRAFLGRFPAANEIAYWTDQLDSGTYTLTTLVHEFASSTEFAEILDLYFGL